MKISKRLLSISKLINDFENIVDIGCDHGLIDIYLTQNKKCNCICYDVSFEIISRAVNNIHKYNLDDKIKVYVGNGFNNLNLNYESTMILSGMGTFTMLKIIKSNKTRDIICQTNTDLYELRKSVCDMGYCIISEDLVFDNNRYYVTIRFQEGKMNYNYDEYLLGPILIRRKDVIFMNYVKNLYDKVCLSYSRGSNYDSFDFLKVEKIMNCLKKYI